MCWYCDPPPPLQAFDFTTALHTYIEVLDVKKAKVRAVVSSFVAGGRRWGLLKAAATATPAVAARQDSLKAPQPTAAAVHLSPPDVPLSTWDPPLLTNTPTNYTLATTR